MSRESLDIFGFASGGLALVAGLWASALALVEKKRRAALAPQPSSLALSNSQLLHRYLTSKQKWVFYPVMLVGFVLAILSRILAARLP